jgi:hypothetical protein
MHVYWEEGKGAWEEVCEVREAQERGRREG